MEDYRLEKGDGWFSIEKELSEDTEKIAEKMEEEYELERDSSGNLHHLYGKNIEIAYGEEKAEAIIYTEKEPDEWTLKGLSEMIEGKEVPVDLGYFTEKDYISELEEKEFPYELDRDQQKRIEGASTETTPRL